MRETWLVVGGAGYIGSHVVQAFRAQGVACVVFDDLSTGLRQRVPDGISFVEASAQDALRVRQVCAEHGITGIVHLAARKHARESLLDPLGYWSNNVGALIGVLTGIKGTRVRSFVLSSSCSIYGEAGKVTEETTDSPVSTYAKTKLVCEEILNDCGLALDLNWLSLRYFNVVGNAEFPGAHDTSSECLVPRTYRALQDGDNPAVYGTEHDTPDGSCLRDYVDVRDLAQAHAIACRRMSSSDEVLRKTRRINISTGSPHSVLEIIEIIEKVGGFTKSVKNHGAQPGDPAAVWADSIFAKELLGWSPKHTLQDSIEAHINSVQLSVPPTR